MPSAVWVPKLEGVILRPNLARVSVANVPRAMGVSVSYSASRVVAEFRPSLVDFDFSP